MENKVEPNSLCKLKRNSHRPKERESQVQLKELLHQLQSCVGLKWKMSKLSMPDVLIQTKAIESYHFELGQRCSAPELDLFVSLKKLAEMKSFRRVLRFNAMFAMLYLQALLPFLL